MNLYVYSDESGVFDVKHNDFFVYGGLMFFSREARDDAGRKYLHVEKTLRQNNADLNSLKELKASLLSLRDRGRIMRSLNQLYKFAIIIREQAVLPELFTNKWDKQRYLDYAYKIGLKRFLQSMISRNLLKPGEVEQLLIHCDEHTTATSGRYGFEAGLRGELCHGTFNMSYNRFFPPLFPHSPALTVRYCASDQIVLIRAADIIANHVYNAAVKGLPMHEDNLFVTALP